MHGCYHEDVNHFQSTSNFVDLQKLNFMVTTFPYPLFSCNKTFHISAEHEVTELLKYCGEIRT